MGLSKLIINATGYIQLFAKKSGRGKTMQKILRTSRAFYKERNNIFETYDRTINLL